MCHFNKWWRIVPTPIRHFLLCFLIVVGIDSVSIENPQLVLTTVVRLKWAGSATEGLVLEAWAPDFHSQNLHCKTAEYGSPPASPRQVLSALSLYKSCACSIVTVYSYMHLPCSVWKLQFSPSTWSKSIVLEHTGRGNTNFLQWSLQGWQAHSRASSMWSSWPKQIRLHFFLNRENEYEIRWAGRWRRIWEQLGESKGYDQNPLYASLRNK